MINGYFGPRLLYPIGFTEHKVDQAWLIERTQIDHRQARRRRIPVRARTAASSSTGTSPMPLTSRPRPPASSSAAIWLCSTCWRNSRPTAWAGSISSAFSSSLPPSDFAEGLLNSHCRPEGNGQVVITSTEADQGNLVPMELMKRILMAKGLPEAVMFHDVRWGARHDGRFLWVLLNSGSCSAYAFNHDVASLDGVHSYRQPAGYFPVARRHVRRLEPARPDHLGPLLDRPHRQARHGPGPRRVGRPARRRSRVMVARHNPPVAVHGRRPRLLDGNDHGPLHEQPHRRRLRRHLRRNGRLVPVARLPGRILSSECTSADVDGEYQTFQESPSQLSPRRPSHPSASRRCRVR